MIKSIVESRSEEWGVLGFWNPSLLTCCLQDKALVIAYFVVPK
jgi:hypothetical protein